MEEEFVLINSLHELQKKLYGICRTSVTVDRDGGVEFSAGNSGDSWYFPKDADMEWSKRLVCDIFNTLGV